MVLQLNAAPVVKGARTFIPGVARLLPESGGAAASAEYCYGVMAKAFGAALGKRAALDAAHSGQA